MNRVVPVERRCYTFRYSSFVERSHLETALFETGYGTSPMARKLNRRLSMNYIATSLKNVSMKTSGSSKGYCTDV
jgi:hypothetical protein